MVDFESKNNTPLTGFIDAYNSQVINLLVNAIDKSIIPNVIKKANNDPNRIDTIFCIRENIKINNVKNINKDIMVINIFFISIEFKLYLPNIIKKLGIRYDIEYIAEYNKSNSNFFKYHNALFF